MQFTIRSARVGDVPAIADLVAAEVQRRRVLGKSLVTLYEDVPEFVVAEADETIVGCGALHVIWEDLAEVRTVVVSPGCRGRGVGARLVAQLEENAVKIGVRHLFCLTFAVDFFAAQGFSPTDGVGVDGHVYAQLLQSHDEGIAEFLDLTHVRPNTLGNTRMAKELRAR